MYCFRFRHLLLVLTGMVLGCLGLIPLASGQRSADGYVVLHTSAVDPASKSIVLDVGANPTRITAIRILSSDADIVLSRVVVHYANGQAHYDERRHTLKAGERTPEIDARDEDRIVDSISFSVDPVSAAGISPQRISISILGRSSVGVAPPPAPVVARPADSSASPTNESRGAGTFAKPAASAPRPKYVELGVFYGTNRRKEADRLKSGRRLASFSGEQGPGLILGRAIVTIPIERERGTIPRPETNLIVARVAFRNEDPNRDFTLASVDVMDSKEFLEQTSRQLARASRFKDQALVFVHGYNVSFDDSIFRTAQIAYDIGFDGLAVTFSWPSRGGTWDYRHDIDTAKASRDGLRDLLEKVAAVSGIKSVNLIAHSMGNDPVVELMRQQGEIKQSGGTVPDLKLNEIVLAAPDVSRAVLEQFATRFAGIARGGVTLYASRNDRALLASKSFASGLVRAGDVPKDGIVVVRGIESIDISDASTGFFSTNHSAFADREHLIEDMRLLFARSVRPPNERFAVYRAEGKAPLMWWRYRRN